LRIKKLNRTRAKPIRGCGPRVQTPANYYPAAAPVNWSGYYIGVNGGYGLGTSNWGAAGASIGAFDTSGLLVGGTLGYNLQAGAFVFGVGADDDWTNHHGGSPNAYCSSVTVSATCETKSTWLATGRIRMGYAFDRVHIYGTGGIAFGDIQAGYNPRSIFDSATTSAGLLVPALNSLLTRAGRLKSNTSMSTLAVFPALRQIADLPSPLRFH